MVRPQLNWSGVVKTATVSIGAEWVFNVPQAPFTPLDDEKVEGLYTEFGGASNFVNYDTETMTVFILANVTKVEDVGAYFLRFFLRYNDNVQGPATNFELIIEEPKVDEESGSELDGSDFEALGNIYKERLIKLQNERA